MAMPLSLRQQLIQSRTEDAAEHLKVKHDDAFMRVVYSAVMNRSITDVQPGDLVDGGQDKQIDIVSLNTTEDEATIHILCIKNEKSFQSNVLIQLRNGLEWIFGKTMKDVKTLSNGPFKERIENVRDVMKDFFPSNITVKAKYVTNASTHNLSDEVLQEKGTIRQFYDNGTFRQFDFQLWGADELVDAFQQLEKSAKKVNWDLPIIYDKNVGSLVKVHSANIRGMICTVSGKEIAKLVTSHMGSVFDANIRVFLGTQGAVNEDIYATCSNAKTSHQFWFLNNGLTIVCDQFSEVPLPDNAMVKMKNLQIVNGCQTAMTLAEAENKGQLVSDVNVLTRIYETADSNLGEVIVRTTNTQNKISSRDLHSNDNIQVDMEKAFLKYGLSYERKARQYDGKKIDPVLIFTNEAVGQSYLAAVLKKPSDARRRKYKVWGEYYKQIFSGKAIEGYVLPALVYRSAARWLKLKNKARTELQHKVAHNGELHLTRMVAFEFLGGDFWNNTELLASKVKALMKDASPLDSMFAGALKTLTKIIKKQVPDLEELDAYLKSAALDTEIDKRLYKGFKKI